MNYLCVNRQTFQRGDYSIIPVRKSDMGLIRQWRNEQISVLRQISLLTEKDQEKYYKNVIEPSFRQKQPYQILFSYLLSGQIIGYGGLTNIDWNSKRAEVSFLLETNRINDKKLYHKEYSNFLILLKEVAFKKMIFHKLFTETYNIRPTHIKVLEENGFKLEGRLREHVIVDGKYIDSLIHGFIYRG